MLFRSGTIDVVSGFPCVLCQRTSIPGGNNAGDSQECILCILSGTTKAPTAGVASLDEQTREDWLLSAVSLTSTQVITVAQIREAAGLLGANQGAIVVSGTDAIYRFAIAEIDDVQTSRTVTELLASASYQQVRVLLLR